jgi:peroxiredoxin Q/BCP
MSIRKFFSEMNKDPHTTKLQEGDKAPAFSFTDKNGKQVALSDLAGKKVVLYFYPKDDTPGCTAESCNLRDNYNRLKKKGFEVIGVSKDDERSHAKFVKKYDLPFALVPDSDKKIISDYDVWGEKKFMGRVFEGIVRTTFLIDEKGKIERIFRKVDTQNHTEQILESLTTVKS